MKPEYRLRMQIEDNETGQLVMATNTYLPNEKRVGDPVMGLENLEEENAEMEFWSFMRHFRNGGQQKYEEENYSPKEVEV